MLKRAKIINGNGAYVIADDADDEPANWPPLLANILTEMAIY